MPAPKGDEYWARWSYGFCQVAKVSMYPNRDYAKIVDMHPRAVSTTVFRMRERGLITQRDDGLFLTEKAEELLKRGRRGDVGIVALDLHIRAKSKEEALAEVWDVITQLESWDPRAGEPFRLVPARTKILADEG